MIHALLGIQLGVTLVIEVVGTDEIGQCLLDGRFAMLPLPELARELHCRVVTLGQQDSESPVAIPYSELRQVGAVNLDFEGQPTVVLWAPGANSALDREYIDEGTDVGATGVFSAVVDGQHLTFTREEAEDAPITDVETGSTWDITGRAVGGSLAGSVLEPLNNGDHFWFAWAAFVPHTDIWTTEGVLSLSDEEAT